MSIVMKMATLACLSWYVMSASAYGQAIRFIRQFGGLGFDRASAVAVDASGVYLVGVVGAGDLPGQNAAGLSDAFVRKYDAFGNELWTRQFGSPLSDDATACTLDGGGIYAAGVTLGALPGQISAGKNDVFVRKYDALGNELWTRQFGSSTDELPGSIAADASGVYIVGSTLGALPGQIHAGYGADVFVRKYDTQGNHLWTAQFGSPMGDSGFSTAIDPSGIYVAGLTSGALPGQIHAGGADAFVRKYNPNGNLLWTHQFGDTGFDAAMGVAADINGVYVVGDTQPRQPEGTLRPQGFLRRYNAMGALQWERRIAAVLLNGREQTGARHVAVDAGGAYVFGIIIDGALPGQMHAGAGIPEDADVYVRKYDPTGNLLWTDQFGTPRQEFPREVAVHPTGVYVLGYTFGALLGQVNAGQNDIFVRKYDTGGNPLWTRQFGSPDQEGPGGIVVSSTGAYIVGETSGALPGQNFAGNKDAFLVRLVPPPEDVILSLLRLVQGLGPPAGPLNAAQLIALNAKLNPALVPGQAGLALNAFINQVKVFVNAGILPLAQGNALIEQAELAGGLLR